MECKDANCTRLQYLSFQADEWRAGVGGGEAAGGIPAAAPGRQGLHPRRAAADHLHPWWRLGSFPSTSGGSCGQRACGTRCSAQQTAAFSRQHWRLAHAQLAGGPLHRQKWAGQLARTTAAVGVEIALEGELAALHIAGLRAACIRHFVGRLLFEAEQGRGLEGRGRYWYYVTQVRDSMAAEGFGPAAYTLEVRSRGQRQALAQLRTRSHWAAEETGLHGGQRDRALRVCPRCPGSVEEEVCYSPWRTWRTWCLSAPPLQSSGSSFPPCLGENPPSTRSFHSSRPAS